MSRGSPEPRSRRRTRGDLARCPRGLSGDCDDAAGRGRDDGGDGTDGRDRNDGRGWRDSRDGRDRRSCISRADSGGGDFRDADSGGFDSGGGGSRRGCFDLDCRSGGSVRGAGLLARRGRCGMKGSVAMRAAGGVRAGRGADPGSGVGVRGWAGSPLRGRRSGLMLSMPTSVHQDLAREAVPLLRCGGRARPASLRPPGEKRGSVGGLRGLAPVRWALTQDPLLVRGQRRLGRAFLGALRLCGLGLAWLPHPGRRVLRGWCPCTGVRAALGVLGWERIGTERVGEVRLHLVGLA